MKTARRKKGQIRNIIQYMIKISIAYKLFVYISNVNQDNKCLQKLNDIISSKLPSDQL